MNVFVVNSFPVKWKVQGQIKFCSKEEYIKALRADAAQWIKQGVCLQHAKRLNEAADTMETAQ